MYFSLWNYLRLSIFLLLDFDEHPTCSTTSSSSVNPPPPFSINRCSTHGFMPLLLLLFGDLEILYFLLNPVPSSPSSQVTYELSCPFGVYNCVSWIFFLFPPKPQYFTFLLVNFNKLHFPQLLSPLVLLSQGLSSSKLMISAVFKWFSTSQWKTLLPCPGPLSLFLF